MSSLRFLGARTGLSLVGLGLVIGAELNAALALTQPPTAPSEASEE